MPGRGALHAAKFAVAALAGRVSRPQDVEQLRPEQRGQREQHHGPFLDRQRLLPQEFGVGRRAVVEHRRHPVAGQDRAGRLFGEVGIEAMLQQRRQPAEVGVEIEGGGFQALCHSVCRLRGIQGRRMMEMPQGRRSIRRSKASACGRNSQPSAAG